MKSSNHVISLTSEQVLALYTAIEFSTQAIHRAWPKHIDQIPEEFGLLESINTQLDVEILQIAKSEVKEEPVPLLVAIAQSEIKSGVIVYEALSKLVEDEDPL